METNFFVENQIQILSHYDQGAIINQSDQIIYIPKKHLSVALNKDLVKIKVSFSEVETDIINIIRACGISAPIIGIGQVIQIIKRAEHQSLCGIFQIKSNRVYGLGKNGGRYYLFCPLDYCYPALIILSKINPIQYTKNIYIVAKF